MKIDFKDTIKDVSCNFQSLIKGKQVTCINAEVMWQLGMSFSDWGVSSFEYDVYNSLFLMKIENESNEFEVNFFVEQSYSKCRVYHNVQENNKWEEKLLDEFEIKREYIESPESDSLGRSQVYIKNIELIILPNEKKIVYTI
jgi:hypothetical protein